MQVKFKKAAPALARYPGSAGKMWNPISGNTSRNVGVIVWALIKMACDTSEGLWVLRPRPRKGGEAPGWFSSSLNDKIRRPTGVTKRVEALLCIIHKRNMISIPLYLPVHLWELITQIHLSATYKSKYYFHPDPARARRDCIPCRKLTNVNTGI